MDLLKKNYDKLILLALVLAFVCSMIYVLDIIRKTREVTDRDLQIPTREPNYVEHKADESDFVKDKLFQLTAENWTPAASRGKVSDSDYSDLVAVFKIARCPHCERLIPLSYFNNRKCPFCPDKAELPPPPERKMRKITADDSDGDGISNVDEQKYGFDAKNADDAMWDFDKDGFSNVYEIFQGTHPKIAVDHPPFWHRLYLKTIATVPLPLRFMAVNDVTKSKDPQKCDFQVNHYNRRTRRWTTRYYAFGEDIDIDGRKYKIAKVDLIQKEVAATAPDGQPTVKDDSVIYLDEVGGTDKLVMKVGEVVNSSDRKAVFIDTGLSGEYAEIIGGLGSVFIMRGNKGEKKDRVRYRVKEIDLEHKTVLLENVLSSSRAGVDLSLDPKGEKMLVTTDGKIPADMRRVDEPPEAAAAAGEGAAAPEESASGRGAAGRDK
ncbi:MAG: hypothetical protein PHI35_05500 [Victivallaceae bacterium]|nr:hypothetical protein [Victivallaceae bacterium]